MGKRGQVTVFVIIGLLMLIFIGIILIMREKAIDDEGIPEILPEHMFKLKVYADQCLKTATEDALRILGTQGGYVYLPEYINLDPLSYISLTGSSAPFAMKIPYWYYKGENRIPSIEQMEIDLGIYIEDNLPKCINGFSAFANEFNITEREGGVRASAQIGDEAVLIKVIYPFDIRTLGSEEATRLSKFSTDVDIKLKRIFTLAREILRAENEQMYFEKTTIDLMALGREVPFTDVEFTCGRIIWLKTDVEQAIKDLLFYNLPKIRVKNTDHEPFIEENWKYEELQRYDAFDIIAGNIPENQPSDRYDYFHFFWDVTSKDYSDLKIEVNYQKEWPMYMDVKPRQGNIMKSSYGQGNKDLLRFICVNSYHFTYDVEYPVQITIKDDNAFRNEGFLFNFAIPIIIKDNEGNRADVPFSNFEAPEGFNLDACGDRVDTDTFIYARDKYTNTEILDVNLSFECMQTVECPLGRTETEVGVNRLTTRLPSFCSPGSIIAAHNNYHTVTQRIEPGQNVINVIMTPKKRLDVKVFKRQLSAGIIGEPIVLESGEEAIIFISSEQVPGLEYYAKYPFNDFNENNPLPESMKTISLADDDDITYDLDIYLLRHDKVMIGGFSGNFTVSRADLEGKEDILFNVLEYLPHPEEDTEIFSMFEAMNDEKNLKLIRPDFR